jgi:hypothetical protein
MFIERWVSDSGCKQIMTSFMGQASWAKMASAGGKLMELACHPAQKLNKVE